MTQIAEWLLRVGIAGSFLYPPIAALFSPFNWVGYFPAFLTQLVGDEMVLLHVFGAIEVFIAVWLLSTWRVHWAAVVSAVLLFGIVIFNFASLDVLFRDISLALAALALAALTWPRTTSAPVEASEHEAR